MLAPLCHGARAIWPRMWAGGWAAHPSARGTEHLSCARDVGVTYENCRPTGERGVKSYPGPGRPDFRANAVRFESGDGERRLDFTAKLGENDSVAHGLGTSFNTRDGNTFLCLARKVVKV